jgi:ankyrin repeat protein
MVQLLLDASADVNAPAAGIGGITALRAAAEEGNFELVRLFLDIDADVDF